FSVPFYIWDASFDALTQAGFRVLRFDFFGRGFSDRPRLPYDRALFTRQTSDLVHALEFPTPFSLAGLSMGGIIAAEFAVHNPKLVAKLILIDPAGFPLDFPLSLRIVRIPLLGELLLNLAGPQALLKAMASDLFDPKLVDAFIAQYRIQMGYKGFFRAILSTMRRDVLADALPTYRRLSESQRPTMLIWGRHDETVPFEYSRMLVDALPRLQFHPIDRAGHLPHYERPEVVNPILVEFLQA
ncbi:MAG: alpha/beta hydrolase, partial [Anaerolineae bacterium]|nr:alpha/beta hydrolase [Anaerolineae bacterium]